MLWHSLLDKRRPLWLETEVSIWSPDEESASPIPILYTPTLLDKKFPVGSHWSNTFASGFGILVFPLDLFVSPRNIFTGSEKRLQKEGKLDAPLIDGILKIGSLGDDFEQVNKLYASDSMWSTAHQMLDACPSQSALSAHQYEHWLECSQQHSRSSIGRHNQAHLDEGVEAIKAFLLQSGVSVPLKKFTFILPY